MGRQVYVIVHEQCILNDILDERYPATQRRALAVSRVLARIKREHDYLEIKNLADELHPDLPPPSERLEVKVVGAYTEICVTAQLRRLSEAGYSARAYARGCLSEQD